MKSIHKDAASNNEVGDETAEGATEAEVEEPKVEEREPAAKSRKAKSRKARPRKARPRKARPETKSEEGPTETLNVVPVVAGSSRRSAKYHLVDCQSAKKIAKGKLVEFKSEAIAQDAGLEPCKRCLAS